jgi:hypothetical protein
MRLGSDWAEGRHRRARSCADWDEEVFLPASIFLEHN